MQLPARIGKYELEEFLGGSMSNVYRARDIVLGRSVVLKILTEAGCADPEAKARFLQEARLASNIVHENIISVYDFGEERGQPFIVMEYLRGDNLRDLIRQGRTGDYRKKLNMALQIARALGYIHSHRIVHRDIKPENIHIDAAAGKIKLMDFGIAKSEGVQLTRAGFTLGTPYYMAPEQVTGERITHLVDVYAFGILLFELMTGIKPVTGDSVDQIFGRILQEPIRQEPLRAAGVPQPVIDLISRCTEKLPAARIQSFNEICALLEEMLAVPAALPGRPAQALTAPVGPAHSTPAAVAMPGLLAKLPARLQTQNWIVVLVAIAVLLIMSVFYFIARALIR